MATIAINTTADEDAAILALGLDVDPQAFVHRHVAHQIAFAISQQTAVLKTVYDILPADDKAAVDAILERNRPQKEPKP